MIRVGKSLLVAVFAAFMFATGVTANGPDPVPQPPPVPCRGVECGIGGGGGGGWVVRAIRRIGPVFVPGFGLVNSR